MKICVLSCIAPLSDSRNCRIVQSLVEMNHEVWVIMPNPSDQALDGKLLFMGLPEIRHNFWPDSSLFNLIQAIFNRLRNFILAVRALVHIRPDIFFCIEPDSWSLAVLFAWVKGSRVVVDLQEVYEDKATAFPKAFAPTARLLIRNWLMFLSRWTDHIIHVSPERQQVYSHMSPTSTIVSLYPSLEKFPILLAKSAQRTVSPLDRFILIHAGALRSTYASEQLVEAVRLVKESIPNLKLIVLGGVAGTLKNHRCLEDLTSAGTVELQGHIPFDEVNDYLVASDVGLSLVLPIGVTYNLAQPRKLYEYFAAGLPVIAADVPTLRRVITEWNCGLLVDPHSPRSIAEAILQLYQNVDLRLAFGRNARHAAERQFNWDGELTKLQQLLASFSGKAPEAI
jgi:glycosyltransferase involved in cell wall biosynthesis